MASQEMKNLLSTVKDYILSLGDDVSENRLKLYIAYKKVRNIACIELYSKMNKLIVRLQLSPDTVKEEKGFIRNTTNIGHYGTREVEITLKNAEDFEKIKPLIDRAYNEN